ncbi:HAMP domain-containing protein, partial [Candidatus Ozemobacteraceae bacterium]|nr:HAMP domain-containing protein [Candidatus Ozemobacteraceae bacterium]
MTNRTTKHCHSGWLAVLLPLLVGIIPLLILHAEAGGLISLARESAVQKWLGTVRSLAERYQERATPEFWLEDGLRQMTTDLHRGAPAASASQTLSSSISSLHRRGLRGLMAWAAVKDPSNPSGPFVLLEGGNLRSDFRVFFRGLLRELAHEADGILQTGGSESWTSRLKATFGEGVPTELFTSAWRGQAFFITFRHQFGLAAWEALHDPTGATNGAVFLFWPLDLDFARQGVELAIRHWKTISPSPIFIPTAIDLPAPGTRHRRRIVLPSHLAADLQARQALRALGRRLKATPISTNVFESLQTPRIGGIDLKALDIPVTDGPTWLYPLPLPPLSGHAGVIVSPAPAIPLPVVVYLRNAGAISLVVAFLIFAAMVATGRTLPSFSVRSTLLLWLLVLAAIPAALLLAAQERLAADRASNRRTELRSTLHRHLERIDSGSSAITQGFLQTCRDILRSPSLPDALDNAIDNNSNSNIILNDIESRCASSGMELSGIFIFGHAGFKLTRVSPSISPDTAGRLAWYHEFLAAETLARISPQIARESKSARKKRTSSAAEMGNLEIIARNENFLGPADTAYGYRLGNRHVLRYFDFIYHRGGARYMIFILWTQDRVYRRYLSESLARLNREHPDFGACAFRQHGSILKLESASATPGQIGALSLAARNLPDSTESLSETVLFKGKTMPEYTLGITAPLDPIHREQSNDLFRSLLIFFCMLTLLFGAGVLLSGWLADPVRRMSEALRRVSADDLETRVHIARADELGSTADILDTMIGWLRERRAMSRFVSSQVLDVVSGGNLSGRADAIRSQAALLVTDVRSFTTLSESHAAPEIFSMLNAHLAAMTAIIQKHGGSIDRFIGDAIQAVFLPTGASAPADRALRAGFEMMQTHRQLQRERQELGAFTYGIGVGIDQGEVVTGILGDPQVRLDFTVLGEPLKHAADLEALSKFGRHTLVITSDAVKHTVGGDFIFEPLASGIDGRQEQAWELVHLHPAAGTRNLTIERDAGSPHESSIPGSTPTGHSDVLKEPQPPTIPRPEIHAVTRPSAVSVVSIAIALVLWVTPLLLILTASHDLDNSSREAIGSRVRAQLRQDIQLAEQTRDPHLPSLLLIQQLLSPVMTLDCNVPDSRRIIQSRIFQLRKLFPGLRCVFTFGRSGSDDPPAGLAFGKPHIFTLDEWKDVFQLFRGELQASIYPTSPGHDVRWLRAR